MRKKMLFLALALAAAAGSLTASSAVASGNHSCPFCVTYANGSQCCHSCICNSSGFPVACTQNYCPPAGGGE
jgi:hypothetical protein